MTIYVYKFETRDGREVTFETQDANEAKAHAQEHGLRCIEHRYTFEDSELVWDYTDDESDEESDDDVATLE